MTSFTELPLRPATRAALAAMGIDTPTPIQEATLPSLLAGADLVGQARTGSGKTIAFALPIVERIDERRRTVQALVLTPTRELAAQVAGVVRDLARGRPLRTLLLVGGLSAGPQTAALKEGVHVVVGTPGRVLDHVRQGVLRLDGLRLLVLDEADEMLDRGFGPDVERIMAACNAERQTALFTATVPEWLDRIAKNYLRQPISVKVDPGSQPVENVEHTVYDVPDGGKLAVLRALLDNRPPGATLVFGRTKHGVRKLAKQLDALGYPAAALQGNISQNARDRVIADFRSGAAPVLLATNVAARGLDVDRIARVINYELPETAGLLTHRVGRTGRMGRDGEAITLLSPDDEEAWGKLRRELNVRPSAGPGPATTHPPPLPQPLRPPPNARSRSPQEYRASSARCRPRRPVPRAPPPPLGPWRQPSRSTNHRKLTRHERQHGGGGVAVADVGKRR